MPYQHMDTEQVSDVNFNLIICMVLFCDSCVFFSIEKLETPKGDDVPAKQYLVRRSKKLPKWLWIAIAQSLG